jgi:3-isopropylmalate/(R)-2-methylmalate dehydratase small subunit
MKIKSRAVVLPVDDIDTDQIIPARFLKVTDKQGLGEKLFADWRFVDGAPRADFVLNRPDAAGAQILIAGNNFGCGSSREHAAWALAGFGFRVVVAESFADIFRQNALKNALLPVTLEEAAHRALANAAQAGDLVEVDLREEQISWPGWRATFAIDPFARRCILDGVDELGYLLSLASEIDAFEAVRR